MPGLTLLGADSHSTTAAGLSLLAIGAGGLDVALAMAGHPFSLPCPKVLGVKLTGQLPPWVSGKDVILEMLRRHTVKGGVGKVIEYYGTGVATLSATDRATIGNMGAELGATSSLFPSDERTREFLAAQGSRQVLENVAQQGGVLKLLMAGINIHQSGCLGCIGMGQAPGSGQISLRTFPRNFPGRSGTRDDKVYLCSPETAAASGLNGVITDPRDLGTIMSWPNVQNPAQYLVDDSSIISPLSPDLAAQTEIVTGPNIVPFPTFSPLPDFLSAEVVLKVGDNITTDHIMPAGNKILPLRSNIPAISRYVFEQLDPTFAERAESLGDVVVVAGENYGQGSSREHAALAPRYLGVRAKIAKGFARIHKANLVNFGILPLTFKSPSDYERIKQGSKIECKGVRELVQSGATELPIMVDGLEIRVVLDVSDRQRHDLLAGGTLNAVKEAGV